MHPLRISLATLLAIVAIIALGLAGMTSASSFWTAAAATVTLALLLAAVLAACLLAGSDRAFWAGFALFGWIYLVLVNWDWVGGQFGHDLTAGLSDMAESIFAETPATGPQAAGFVPPGQPAQIAPGNRAAAVVTPAPSPTAWALNVFQLVRQRQIKIGNFVQIGRMLLSLLFALVGGFIGRALAERRESRTGSSGPAATG
jgi:hypothetical protein